MADPNTLNVCEPVSVEGLETLGEPGFEEVADEVATQAEATFAYPDSGAESDTPAARAMKQLGCVACEASNVCAVRQNLEDRDEAARGTNALREKSEMIASAPTWLAAARQNRTGLGAEQWNEVRNNPSLLRDVAEDPNNPNQLSLDDFLGGVTNTPAGVQLASDFPELQNIKNIDAQTTKFDNAARITTEQGQSYLVVDATGAVDFKQQPLAAGDKEYGILTAKLLDRMTETDADGNPQIFTPDNKQQKAIDPSIYEMRMAKKNRLYFTLAPNPDGETTARIVILGTHGGDDSTQQQFIDNTLRKQKR